MPEKAKEKKTMSQDKKKTDKSEKPEKPEKPDKAEKPKVKSTPEELAAGHKDKVKHCVTRLDTWLEKTVKAIKSKKYPLSDAQREKVLAHIDESYEQFKAVMAGGEKKEEFTLD